MWAVALLTVGWILAFIEPTPIGEGAMFAITGLWASQGIIEDE